MGRRLLRRDADRLVEMRFTQLPLGFNGPGWDVDTGAPWLAWRDSRSR
jgi:hypothetical protein